MILWSDQLPDGLIALHQYRRGHGFESRSGLNCFQALIQTTAKVVCITAMINHKISYRYTEYFRSGSIKWLHVHVASFDKECRLSPTDCLGTEVCHLRSYWCILKIKLLYGTYNVDYNAWGIKGTLRWNILNQREPARRLHNACR